MRSDREVCHIYRETNKCVDVLVNEGCIIDFETRIYESCPDDIHELYS
jgi:hypothetical protein